MGNSLGVSLKITGTKRLSDFALRHPISRGNVTAWLKEAEEASWQTPQEIKDRYKTASFLDGNKIFFNINGNHYRLLVKIDYARQILMIEWIGTHAEYTKKYC